MAACPAAPRPAPWSLVSPGVFDAAMPGLLVALAGGVFGLMRDGLLDNVTLVAWLCAGLTLWTAATFARKASA